MRALIVDGIRSVKLTDWPEPQPADGDVRVHVRVAGLCGSDVHAMHGGVPSLPLPLIMGHEFGGVLDDGTPVVVNPMLCCGACAACDAGRTHLCPQRRVLGFRASGGFAERVVLPRRNAVPAPGLTATQAALVEPVANGVHAWHRAGRPTGAVAVIGAGAVGMSLLHVLRSRGLREVTVIDPVAERRAHARAAGAAATAERLEGQFEAVFDAAGTASTRRDAVACTQPGGSVALLGLHDDVLQLSASALVVGDRTLAGCFAYTEAEFAEAVELAATLDAPWAQILPFGSADAAVIQLLAGQAPAGRIKTLFEIST